MKKYLHIVAFFATFQTIAQNDLKIGQWQMFQPYQVGAYVTQSDEHVYWTTGLSILKMDKTDFSLEKMDKLNRLSEVGTGVIRYNPANKMLLVAYANSVIDLVSENQTRTLSDIRNNANIIGDKTIYDVFFTRDTAYLACGFGVVKLDTRRGEFVYTTFTKQKVTSVAVAEGKIYAATEGGVYVVNNDARLNMPDFSIWRRLGAAAGFPAAYQTRNLVTFDNRLYLDVNDSLCYLKQDRPLSIAVETDFSIKFLTAEGKSLVAGFEGKNGQRGKVILFDKNNIPKSTPTNCVDRTIYAVEDAQGRVWFADQFLYYRFRNGENAGACNQLNVNSLFSAESSDIAVTDTSVWFAAGGLNGINPLNRRDGFSSYINGQWRNYNGLTERILSDSAVGVDAFRVAISPKTGKVYVGSVAGGLIELQNNAIAKIYNQFNSTIAPSVADFSRQRVTGLAFDKNGNLWIANNIADRPIVVFTADGKWLRMASVPTTNVFQVSIDGAGHKWFVISGSQTGLLVYDEGKTLDNTSDDRYRLIDNANLPKDLQNARITCATADLDGRVWVGTSSGVAVFECGSDPFRSTCNGRAVVSGLGGIGEYLLRERTVNVIAVDGGNRKWFGTSSGIFVTSADGKDELLKFNTENSPLPSNNITALAVRQKTGEVFIGTDKGLMVYRTDAIAGGNFNSDTAYAYPNPVRPDYEGPIAIKGLARDANVKITDADGNIVYETKALGGQAIWDGRDFNGRRVQTGVYLVFATNTRNLDAPEAIVTKLLFVN